MFVFLQAMRRPQAFGDDEEKKKQKYFRQLDELSRFLPKNPDNFIGNKKGEERLFWRFTKFLYDAAKELGEPGLEKLLTEWAHKKDALGKEDPMKLYALGHMLAHASSSLIRKEGESNAWIGKDFNGVQGHFDPATGNAWTGIPKDDARLEKMSEEDIRRKTMLAWMGAYDAALKEQLKSSGVPPEQIEWYAKSAESFADLKKAADRWFNEDQSDKERGKLARSAGLLLSTYIAQVPKKNDKMGSSGQPNIATSYISSNTIFQDEFRGFSRAREKYGLSSDETINPSVRPGQYRGIGLIDYFVEKVDNTKFEDQLDEFCNYAAESLAYQLAFNAKAYPNAGSAQKVFDYLDLTAFDLLSFTSPIRAQFNNDLTAIHAEFYSRFVSGDTKGAFDMLDRGNSGPFGELVSSIEDRTKVTQRQHTIRKVMLQTFDFSFPIWAHENKDFVRALQNYTQNIYSGPQLFFGGAIYFRFRGTRSQITEDFSESVRIGAKAPSATSSSSKWMESKGLFGFQYSHWMNFLMPVKALDDYMPIRYRGKLGWDAGGYTVLEKDGRTTITLSDLPEKLGDIGGRSRVTYRGDVGLGIGSKFALNVGGSFGPEKPIFFSYADYKVFEGLKLGNSGVLAMNFRVTGAAKNTGMPPEIAVLFTYDLSESTRLSAGMAAVPRGVTFDHIFPRKVDVTNISVGASYLGKFLIFNNPFINANIGYPTERIGDIGFPSAQVRFGCTIIPPPSKYEAIRREF